MKAKIDGAKYLGGLPDRKREADDLTLIFDDEGFRAKGRLLTILQAPWSAIDEVTVDGPDTIQSRTTVTRLVGLGLFAFAFKKKKKQAFVTVATTDGTGVFEIEKQTPAEVTAKLGAAMARSRQKTAAPPPPPPPSPAASAMPASWAPDPTGRHELRYWDGERWTDHVSDAGTQSSDPI